MKADNNKTYGKCKCCNNVDLIHPSQKYCSACSLFTKKLRRYISNAKYRIKEVVKTNDRYYFEINDLREKLGMVLRGGGRSDKAYELKKTKTRGIT